MPAETAIPLRLLTTINSRTAYVGEPVFCRTVYPVAVDNRIVIPVGTYVKGSLTEVKNPRAIKGRSQLGMRFDNMTFPNGMTLDLAAALSGYGGAGEDSFKPSEGRVGGGETQSKVQAAEIITVTAAEGSLIGALSSRSATGGDVGAAAGGGGMLALMLLSRSKPVIMGPGTSLELRLTRPISFDPKYLGRSNVDFQSEETVPPPEDAPPRIHRYIPPDR